jgi:hypothetical protein
MTDLTPYDIGTRCEPKPWLPYGTAVTPATPAENFGKVDFDDDEGTTVCVIHVERNGDGTHRPCRAAVRQGRVADAHALMRRAGIGLLRDLWCRSCSQT